MKKNESKIQIGCQGWNYADWVTKAGGEAVFYPRGTKPAEMLEIYARAFETVEVDSTFYAVPSETTLQSWYDKTPADFTFALKMPQEITHAHGLGTSSYLILEEFCEKITILKEKLAAVLVQLPPQYVFNEENAATLADFLRRLPRHIKFAIEFRERGWLTEEIYETLAKHNTALCLTDGTWIPRALMLEAAKAKTADFNYVRFMGERDITVFDQISRDQTANQKIWHETLKDLTVPTLIYFSNFHEGFAPASANKMKELFEQKTVKPKMLGNQPSLF
jgi:uncharacterized protein YecE (DUF72 family)